jgi:beta-glucuronidase
VRSLPPGRVLTIPVMRIPRLPALVVLALAACTLALPSAAAAADKPSKKTLYHDGPEGRFLMDGRWLFRLDSADQGVKQRFMRQAGATGWSPVTVPNAWNLGDASNASMAGSIGWYRKDFELPDANRALAWVIRFESVNYRTRVWLNGKPVGENRGAYIPFEFRLNGVKRRGTNRLVVRVDSRRFPTDFPPSGLNVDGVPTGGWWNYSGILREVYLRRVDTVDWKSVHVRPQLGCAACDARVTVAVDMRNVTGRAQRIAVGGRFGSRRLKLGTRGIPRGGIARFQTTFTVRKPRLWSPASPNLYDVALSARAGGVKVAGYVLRTGIRSIKVSNGRLVLNGQAVNFRGVGVHEASQLQGFAIDNSVRERLVTEAKALGATVLRTHYPMHPYIHELADRLGLMIWSEVPVYSVKTRYLKRPLVRELAAKELAKNIEANQNHPSVMLWSLGNELSARPGPVQAAYIKAAAREAKALDPTRPVGLAVAGYPSVGCQTQAYAPLDVVGVNEYFGWYPGPSGQIFDRTRLPAYLDSLRTCYPSKAIVISEFGAEANRDGPVEEKGTYAFQQDFVNFHLGVYATKPWLSGAIYWALNEFWVRPGWEGGNPRPSPPLFQKGLLAYGTWARKPAWADVNRWFTQTQQYAPLG